MTPGLFSRVLGWGLLVILLALYGVGGRWAPYALLPFIVIAMPYLVAVRAGRPLVPDLTGGAFVAAFVLLVVAAILSAQQPTDPLIVVNFIWLLLFIPMQSLFKRMASLNAGVVIARLALIGAALTLVMAIYEGLVLGAERVGRLTSDPIRIADTAVILGFLALIGIMADRSRLRLVYLVGPLLALAVCHFAGTRAAMAWSGVLAVLSILLFVRSRRIAIVAAIAAAGVGAGALVLAARFGIARADTLVQMLQELFAGHGISDGSATVRLAMLRTGWSAFSDSPVYGHGWQRLIEAVVPYLAADQKDIFLTQPHLHNDLANFAVGSGLIGVVAFLTILFAPLIAVLRSARDALYRVRFAGVALLTAAYGLLGLNSIMFGFEVHTALFVGLAAVLLGYCREPVAEDRPVVVAAPPIGWIERGTVWVLLGFGLVLPNIVGLVTPYIVVVIGLGLWLVFLFTGRLPLTYARADSKAMLIAFALLATLFTLTAHAPADALFAFNFTMLFLYGPLAWIFARAATRITPGHVAVLAALGVALTLAMMLYVALAQKYRPYGFNIGPIVLSNAAMALAVVATAGAFALRNRLSLLLPATIAAGIAVTLISQSRGPLVGALPLLLLTGLGLWWLRLRRNWVFVAGSGLFIALLAIAAVLFGNERLSRLPGLLVSLFGREGIQDRTTDIRLALYEGGWRAFLDSPWVGHGWARLMDAAMPYVDPQYADAASGLPQLHNDVLNFAVAGGVAGVATYLVILLTPTIVALRSSRDSLWAARAYAASGLAIVYACGGLTDLMFGHEFHTALFLVLNAVVLSFFRERPGAALSPAST